jgi:hypothetical protein
MAQYKIRFDDGTSDGECTWFEAASLAGARIEATQFAGDILKHEATTFWETSMQRMSVENDSGLVLFEITTFASDAPAVAKPATS